VTAVAVPAATPVEERRPFRLPGPMWMWAVATVVVAVSVARWVSGNEDLTSPSVFSLAVRTAAPIALAGLGGLYAERSGTVNIGLEGMMVLGTVFGGWWAWEFGNPWMGIIGGIIGGMLGGLLLGVATVTFGINHIVAGFAINILAPGVARFMANVLFVGEEGGSLTNSPGFNGRIGSFTMPWLSGGSFFGMSTPDPLGRIASWEWFVVSDVAGLLKGLTTELRFDILLVVVLFAASVYVLWRTPFGLRLRSAGERPSAADSLGVKVVLYRYIGVAISGGLAGFGGAVLVISSGRYGQGQTAGRGFLGLAALVVGNWRPASVAAGAGLFGFFDGLTLRLSSDELVIALLLAVAILLAVAAVYGTLSHPRVPVAFLTAMLAAVAMYVFLSLVTSALDGAGRTVVLLIGISAIAAVLTLLTRAGLGAVAITAAAAALALFAHRQLESMANEFVQMTPYIVTLLVVASRGQALRPPAQAGIPWRKGMQI